MPGVNLLDAFIGLAIDDTKLKVDAKKAGDKAGVAAGDAAGKSMGQRIQLGLKSAMRTGIVQGFGLGVGLGLVNSATAAFGGLVNMIGDWNQAASNLNETVSKSNVIFEDNADEVEAWASTASSSFGQSKRAALDAASGFAGLFSTANIELAKATLMSKKLVELGSDLGSFFNADPAEALTAIRSGLAGEAEPLKRFNVFLSEAAVKAKATELGLKGAHGQLNEGQKILARYQILLEQTSDAQGDFARTSDGLANQQRIANAELEDTQAMLGQTTLPLQLQITKWQVDFYEGIALVGQFLGELGKVAPAMSDALDLREPALMAAAIERVNRTIAEGKVVRDDWRLDAHAMNVALDRMSRKAGTAGVALGELGQDGHSAASGLRDVKGDARGARQALEKLHDVAKTALDDVLEAVYGPAVLAGREAGIKQDIQETKKALDEAKKSGDKLEIAKLRGQLAQERSDLKSTQAELAALGVKPASDTVTAWLERLRLKTDELTDSAKTALYWYDLVGSSSGAGGRPDPIRPKPPSAGSGGGGGANGQGQGGRIRVMGGPVDALEPYTVGERGRELFVPEVDGRVVAHGPTEALLAGAGGGDYIDNSKTEIHAPLMPIRRAADVVRELKRVSNLKDMRTYGPGAMGRPRWQPGGAD